jgi:predicted restriction endonuclease
MNSVLDIYRLMFASLRRGNTMGVYSKAKPIFLITLIDYILLCKDNKFKWGNKQFQEKYLCNYNMGENLIPTSLWKPFFYLSSEPFYSLVWRESPPNKLLKSLSARLLKEYLDYAKLDDELWELLKDESNRLYLRDSIIKNYFD